MRERAGRGDSRSSGAGEAGDDGGEGVRGAVLADDVGDAPALAAGLELVAHLVDRARQGEGHLERVLGRDPERRGDGRSERKETTIKGQTGNATYLDSAASKLSDVRKILGLDAPVRAESVVSLAVPQLDALNQAYGETTGESADRPTGESTDGPATHSHGDDANPVE